LRAHHPESTIDRVLARCRFHGNPMIRGMQACVTLNALRQVHARWLPGADAACGHVPRGIQRRRSPSPAQVAAS